METFADIPIMLFETPQLWENWLSEHHTEQLGVWLKHAKKASSKASVSYQEALDISLCYGWIDSQKRAYNNDYFIQKYTPRRARSIWSKVNIDKVTALTKAGMMKPSGLAAVAAAQANGEWAKAYDSPLMSSIAPDFQAALDKSPKAQEFYLTLTKANAYAFNWRIQTAKKPETRAARIAKFVTMLEKGEKIH